jgi:osmotically-inducible protein OsmY
MRATRKVCYPVVGVAMVILAAGLIAQQPAQEEVYRLANQIRKKIVTLNNYGVFDNITFGISPGNAGYVVTLKGFASRPTLQPSAERVVAGIEMVESVVNEIEVLPTSRQDEDIRLAAYAKIYGHPTLSRYNPNRGTPLYGVRRRAVFGISNDPPIGPHPIHIIVNKGNIALEGVVDTETDKAIAGVQANSVNGAFSVANNLAVLGDKANKG